MRRQVANERCAETENGNNNSTHHSNKLYQCPSREALSCNRRTAHTRRRLGQHFLTRKSVLERIVEATCPEPCDTVIEIGPGKGALTSHLLHRASRVIAIE